MIEDLCYLNLVFAASWHPLWFISWCYCCLYDKFLQFSSSTGSYQTAVWVSSWLLTGWKHFWEMFARFHG